MTALTWTRRMWTMTLMLRALQGVCPGKFNHGGRGGRGGSILNTRGILPPCPPAFAEATAGHRGLSRRWPWLDRHYPHMLLVLATLCLVIPREASSQALSVLHIKVVLIDAGRKAMPVARHALLISDNPSTAPPRRVVTALDGTADVRLRPGNYTVESDQPFAFQGKSYQWTQIVDIAAGRDAVLELTADNAEVESVTSAATASGLPLDAAASSLLTEWQGSVVELWTETTHASGFVIDAKGLVATSQRAIGNATSVEVQLTPAIKVAASVIAADPVRDVAILRIDPAVTASVRPVPLPCGQAAKPRLVDGQGIFAIGAPLHDLKRVATATVSVQTNSIVADFILARGSAGGPVFTAGGGVVGLTSPADDKDESRRGGVRVVRMDDACDAVASAEKKMKDTAPPSGNHLPVEPTRPFPAEALKDAALRRAGSLNPYQISSTDFDVAFITPVMIYGPQYQSEQARRRERGRGTRSPATTQHLFVGPLMDFSNWSEYVANFLPVLLVRVTPKLVEGFWTRLTRRAVQTQGGSIPPIRHAKSSFSRMRVFCGDGEVTPIHPFKLEQRLSESDAIYEGLHVFDPGALGPQCGTVKLVLYSEKEPNRADTRIVDPKVLERIWEDFAPYRDLKQ
jgi:Trypsin-like peptidase domain